VSAGAAADSLGEVQAALAARLEAQHRQLFGSPQPGWLAYLVRRHWDEAMQRFRLADLLRHGFRAGQARILDVGAGCGSFVSLAREAGHDCWGVEPELSRIEVFRRKSGLLRRSEASGRRIVAGDAGRLPFGDRTFDCVTSAQHLEHVDDPQQALGEMIRVTRSGGGVHLRCPDYRGTYEPHYRLPWVPLCPRPIARAYLRVLRRPILGLATLQYVTRPRILRWLRAVEAQGRRIVVIDDHRVTFDNALRRRRLPRVPGAFLGWRLAQYVAALGRRELGISLFVRVLE
jgi:SAM-dependent methyltransferase